jgi:hypothetical protein
MLGPLLTFKILRDPTNPHAAINIVTIVTTVHQYEDVRDEIL